MGHALIALAILIGAAAIVGSEPDGFWYCWNDSRHQILHRENYPSNDDHLCTRFEVWITSERSTPARIP